jgi:hypothetical protein
MNESIWHGSKERQTAYIQQRRIEKLEKRQKENNTWDSNVVPHRSTKQADEKNLKKE